MGFILALITYLSIDSKYKDKYYLWGEAPY